MTALQAGADVWVDFDGHEWPGEVLKAEGAFIRCIIHTDPLWDFGSASARVMPQQTVAVRSCKVRPRGDGEGYQ